MRSNADVDGPAAFGQARAVLLVLPDELYDGAVAEHGRRRDFDRRDLIFQRGDIQRMQLGMEDKRLGFGLRDEIDAPERTIDDWGGGYPVLRPDVFAADIRTRLRGAEICAVDERV